MPKAETLSHSQAFLSTRRGLLADPLNAQVHKWLRKMYVHPTVKFPSSSAKTILSQMVSVLDLQIKKEARFGAALEGVTEFISSPVAPQYVKAFHSIKRPKSCFLGTFVSVVYARALLLQVESQKESGAIVDELKEFVVSGAPSIIGQYQTAQGKLDENFVGHLVTTAEIEAQLDPYFDKALEHSAALFVEAHRPDGEKRNPLAEPGAPMSVLNEDPAAWWRLPASLAFAMTVWHQTA